MSGLLLFPALAPPFWCADARGWYLSEGKSSCRTWAILPELAFHSVIPPNEEVATKFALHLRGEFCIFGVQNSRLISHYFS